ncbi:MAG: thioredoxin domain-containing protein [Nanoarchaeota archaeon]|nr:thioredoxin domain-containing protein [Nanoarchaeota archaeon]
MKRMLWNLVASALISSCVDNRSAGDNYVESRADSGIESKLPPDLGFINDQSDHHDARISKDGLAEMDAGVDASADMYAALSCGTIEWFLEYEDPFSKRFSDETFPLITANYGERVSFSYRHFPLSFHVHSRAAAEAVECAKIQDRFFEYHSRLFSSQEEWRGTERSDAEVRTLFGSYAAELGVEMGEFNSCVDGRETASIVDADIAEGIARTIKGVPTFYIGAETVVGAQPYDIFAATIDRALENCEKF